jgi:pterin-4a-carbinolamine dehydratase
MTGKQMEGDNRRRRALARAAREQGRQPSSAGLTRGAGKQIDSRRRGERAGPPADAGGPLATRGGRVSAPAVNRPPWPLPDPADSTGNPTIVYKDLVTDIGRRAGLEFHRARANAAATVGALAGVLAEPARARLLAAVPAQLADGAAGARTSAGDLPGFLAEVARRIGDAGGGTDQARYAAQATLSALADRDPALIDSLDLPTELRTLLSAPPTGGGIVDAATGAAAPLTEDELTAALAGLPYWSGDCRALRRTLDLPAANLDRVLGRLARLVPEYGRGPRIGRPSPTTAVLEVRTKSLGAVTAPDVALAHRIDEAIDEAGAGMAS